jgi:hypothetical protein
VVGIAKKPVTLDRMTGFFGGGMALVLAPLYPEIKLNCGWL